MTVPEIKFLSAILLVYGLEKPLTYVHAFIVLTCNISVCIKKIPLQLQPHCLAVLFWIKIDRTLKVPKLPFFFF